MKAVIDVWYKEMVPNPANADMMRRLGQYPDVIATDAGKRFALTFKEELPYREAYRQARLYSELMLANPVYEEYCFSIERERNGKITTTKPTPRFYFDGKKWKRRAG